MNQSNIAQSLRELPDVDAPAGQWSTIQARLQADPASRRNQWTLPLAAAASLLFAVTLAWLVPQQPAATTVDEELARLMAASAVFERRLAAAPRVVSGDQAYAAAEIEDLIANIDGMLQVADHPEEIKLLWQQRVALMGELVQVTAPPRGEHTRFL